MSIKEQVLDLAKRAQAARDLAQTEEATKNAVVMPFLRMLGFDVFDPAQVIPEFVADVGIKKGEKVDYAVSFNGKLQYLVEAKSITQKLSDAQYSQLFRYFYVTTASIAILTNGMEYWFFTDIEDRNKMDSAPFFRFSLESFDDRDVSELEKFHKSRYDYDDVRASASSLKYTKAAMAVIENLWANPDDDFVKLVVKNFYEGQMRGPVIDAMRPIIKRAFDDVVRQKIQKRMDVVLSAPESSSQINPEQKIDIHEKSNDDVITTEEEILGFQIIRAIASEVCEVSRISLRDSKSYCAVLFDDNNRKPIARLHFNSKIKFITLFDKEKNPIRIDISRIEDIFISRTKILEAIKAYVN